MHRSDRSLLPETTERALQMKMAPKVTLTYFDLRARAELARLIMAAGEIEFEDKRVSSEWPELKPSEYTSLVS